ncbi:MAG TPA: T9SS type A sorting domain-containing protein, partial [Chitinophagaceae bacterium]|nr:T9SS type A sorting domain-containing protein [Chitinophagaceae bacterium]
PLTATYAQAPGSGDGSWTKFRYIWNSGNATYADLSLNNLTSATSGNDFAIDEISFGIPPPNQPPVANAGTSTTLTLPNNSTTLNGTASSDPDGSIASYAWTKYSGPAGGTISSPAAATTQVTGLTAGVYVFKLQVTDNSGATATDTVSVTVNPAPVCGPLPSGVSTTDVGGGGLLGLGAIATGSACFIAPGTYDIKGAGDLASGSDKFRFVYRSFSGNGTLIVKVTTQDAVNSLNKAGLMFRETTSSGANYAFLGLTSGNGVYLQSQTLLGLSVSTTSTGAGVIKAPYYLKLVRNGSTFTGLVSPDSITWTTIGSKTVSMATSAYVGLAVCSHITNTLSEALFSNWTILNANGQQTNAARTTGTLVAEGSADTQAQAQVLTNGPLKVYPNPTNAGFVVDFSVDKKQNVWLAITSGADGRVCYTETLNGFSGSYHKDLSSIHLSKGTYAITIRTETGIKTIILVKD